MKRTVLIAAGTVLVLVIAFVSYVLYTFRGQPLPTSFSELQCTSSIEVQGQSMEPTIKAGTKLLVDKCANKQNIAADAIVTYQGDRGLNIGRIKERIASPNGVSYKIGQDARPNEEKTVSADDIVASVKN